MDNADRGADQALPHKRALDLGGEDEEAEAPVLKRAKGEEVEQTAQTEQVAQLQSPKQMMLLSPSQQVTCNQVRQVRAASLPSTVEQGPRSSMYDTMVQIKVGQPGHQKTFHIHRGVLSFHSGSLRAILSTKNRDKPCQELIFSRADPAIFTRILNFFYTHKFLNAEHSDARALPWAHIIHIWHFGHVHQIPMMQNAIIDLLARKFLYEHRDSHRGYAALSQQISSIYQATTPDCKLRKLAIKLLAAVGQAGDVDDSVKMAWPREALEDILKAVWSVDYRRKMPCEFMAELRSMCEFHIHDDGKVCEGKL